MTQLIKTPEVMVNFCDATCSMHSVQDQQEFEVEQQSVEMTSSVENEM